MGGRGGGSGIGPDNGYIRRRITDLLGLKKSRGKAKPLDISKMGNMTLEDAERGIRNLSRERLLVFDENDKLVAGYQGNADSVSFPITLLKERGYTVTHNHPKGDAEFGGTFSYADMHNMINSNWAEHRATASGQGEMNYIMRRTADANPRGLRTALNRAQSVLNKNMYNTYIKSYKNAVASGKSNAQARHIARQKMVGVLNAYYKRTLPKYGFEYINRKTTYKYNR